MKELKKFTLRSVIEKGDSLPQKALKHILGGYGEGGGFSPGTCGWANAEVEICNISKQDALTLFDNLGGNWCCDSCSSASYC